MHSGILNKVTNVVITDLCTERIECTGEVGSLPKLLAEEFPHLQFSHLKPIWWWSPRDPLEMYEGSCTL
eukprot:TRINITY_DN6167_c0_g1_i3.p2 TRINITY_DN6167_c0_g1~~TRINITY_DN6167_c0_g1_i3.p2  ORF type:complete len:69 (-),score=19.62 TRINITY_DN6167_c0_g1_i3:46-252(-)